MDRESPGLVTGQVRVRAAADALRVGLDLDGQWQPLLPAVFGGKLDFGPRPPAQAPGWVLAFPHNVRLRELALRWLREELEDVRLRSASPAAREACAAELAALLAATEFALVQDADTLGRLPDRERGEWAAFWEDVRRAQGKLKR